MPGLFLIIFGVLALVAPFLTTYLVWKYSTKSARFKTVAGLLLGLCISALILAIAFLLFIGLYMGDRFPRK